MKTVEVTITIPVVFRVSDSVTDELIHELAWLVARGTSDLGKLPEGTTFAVARIEGDETVEDCQ